MKTKSVRQTATFEASRTDVYEALMDSKTHSKFTGAPAKISRAVGGKFSAHGGYCDGVNLELVPGKRIVQTWRGANWPEGYYSKTIYNLASVGKKTRLTFTQSGVPEKEYVHIKQGWIDHYWSPMKAMFVKKSSAKK
ncbi:MAG: SRPBCC family protein [Candidatus Kapaibacterium sp.]|jgi:activator of HSP90 ATPase